MAEAHVPNANAPASSSSSGGEGVESADFECNICFDLAQDPVITLCGHLYCWPCLYKWLRGHSQCHECPVCKALIDEEKVIPLYGRGKTPSDPRSKPVPGVEIPNRPASQRPATAPPPDDANFLNFASGLMGGFMPMASATFNNFAVSAGVGGFFTPFFSVQFQGFSSTGGGYGGSPGYNYGHNRQFHDTEVRQRPTTQDDDLKKILCVILGFVIIAVLIMWDSGNDS